MRDIHLDGAVVVSTRAPARERLAESDRLDVIAVVSIGASQALPPKYGGADPEQVSRGRQLDSQDVNDLDPLRQSITPHRNFVILISA